VKITGGNRISRANFSVIRHLSPHFLREAEGEIRDGNKTGAWRSRGDRGLVQRPGAPNRGRNPSIRVQCERDGLQRVYRFSKGKGDHPNQPHPNDGPGSREHHSKPSMLTAWTESGCRSGGEMTVAHSVFLTRARNRLRFRGFRRALFSRR
jgi:hypothetical protein